MAGGFIGSVLLVILYALVYFFSERDVALARSTVTIFVTLFNAFIILIIQGVDLSKPATLIKHQRAIALVFVLVFATLAAMYLRPAMLEFEPVTFTTHLWVWGLIVSIWVVAMAMTTRALNKRYFVRRFWALLEGDDKKFSAMADDGV